MKFVSNLRALKKLSKVSSSCKHDAAVFDRFEHFVRVFESSFYFSPRGASRETLATFINLRLVQS